MEETPICASVERDLRLSVDELLISTGSATAADQADAPRPGIAHGRRGAADGP